MASIVRFTRKKWLRWLFGLLLALAGVAAGARHPPAAPGPRTQQQAQTIVGRAAVIDGDTIRIQGESIRINGVDAPESRQTCRDGAGAPYACGRRSADALDLFLAQSRPTTCAFVARDRYKRMVARCARADGADVAAWLVRNGHAVEWTTYSAGRYAEDEAQARRRKAGVWQGPFDNPWDWRAAHRAKG